MKKTLAIIMAALMCLSLCACAGGENNSDNTSEVQNEDTTTETTNTNDTEPGETKPVYETVEITLDNWQDYFEFREIKKIKINGFEEFNGADILYYLVTKDGIELDTKNSTVTVRYILTTEYKSCSVDLEKKTIVYGETLETKIGNPQVVDFDIVTMSGATGAENKFGKYVGNVIISNLHEEKVRHIVNVDVTRITGSISILKDK